MSAKIREEFENGRDYYRLNGAAIRLPESEESESRKCERISSIRAEGREPHLEILAHGLKMKKPHCRSRPP